MTSNLKPYPAYKDSGVPWLGEDAAQGLQEPAQEDQSGLLEKRRGSRS